jgi:hypothetical protein
MIGSDQLGLSIQAAVVLAPVAVYFFLLGLLNSQRCPQLLSARADFFLLTAAMLPIFCLPVLLSVGASVWTLLVAIAAMLAAAAVLAPPRSGQWVVYNISAAEALRAAESALRAMGEPFHREGRDLICPSAGVSLRLRPMGLLRNVTFAAGGEGAARFAGRFEPLLSRELERVETTGRAMASTFLLLATAMLVAPLGLFADRMPEIVRIITDLVK